VTPSLVVSSGILLCASPPVVLGRQSYPQAHQFPIKTLLSTLTRLVCRLAALRLAHRSTRNAQSSCWVPRLLTTPGQTLTPPYCTNFVRKDSGLWFNLKVGLGISRTNADSQWNPVYNAFHRIFCCGNQTICRQFCKRDLDAATLRPALEQGCGKQTPGAKNYFSEWICYTFLMSKCSMRRDCVLGLCTFLVLNSDFRKKTCFARRQNRNLALRSSSLLASTQKVHRPRCQCLLHFDIGNIQQIRS